MLICILPETREYEYERREAIEQDVRFANNQQIIIFFKNQN